VARALQRAGYPIHFVTVARWRAQNWRAEASDHPLEIARAQLDAVAPLVTGDPETTLNDLIDDPDRADLGQSSDAELLRRVAREVANGMIVLAKENAAGCLAWDRPGRIGTCSPVDSSVPGCTTQGVSASSHA
jgi:hypothetical protein